MKTQRGIYLNLNESIYSYNFSGLTFYFSSEVYRNKFINEVKNYVENEILKLEIKYRIKNNFELFFAISLYKKIEKRGFKIEYNNKEIPKDVLIINKIVGDK